LKKLFVIKKIEKYIALIFSLLLIFSFTAGFQFCGHSHFENLSDNDCFIQKTVFSSKILKLKSAVIKFGEFCGNKNLVLEIKHFINIKLFLIFTVNFFILFQFVLNSFSLRAPPFLCIN